MKNNLEIKLQRLIDSRQKLLNAVEGLSKEQINIQPEKGKWSIGQILYHLHLVEKLTLNYMKSKTSELATLGKTGIKERWNLFLLKWALRLPLKFKAPASVIDNIPEKIDLDKLADDWAKTHKEFEAFIADFPLEAQNVKVFKHPRVGKININQTLTFIKNHFDHHLPQVNRLLSKYQKV